MTDESPTTELRPAMAGYAAHTRGDEFTDCPFEASDPQSDDWKRGWLEANRRYPRAGDKTETTKFGAGVFPDPVDGFDVRANNKKESRMTEATHPDDLAVDRFTAMMKAKLALARAKGRGGWEACPEDMLIAMLWGHIEKGDMRDVANLAMMIHLNREAANAQ